MTRLKLPPQAIALRHFFDVLAHFDHFFGRQASGFVEKFTACVQLANIVQEGGCANVIHVRFGEAHPNRDIADIVRDAIGMVVGVFIIGMNCCKMLSRPK